MPDAMSSCAARGAGGRRIRRATCGTAADRTEGCRGRACLHDGAVVEGDKGGGRRHIDRHARDQRGGLAARGAARGPRRAAVHQIPYRDGLDLPACPISTG